MNRPFPSLRHRRIHLDIHTSEAIGGIISNPDANDFAQTLAAEHVDSVAPFASCHNGRSYCPDKVDPAPSYQVGTDLPGKMFEACLINDMETRTFATVERAAQPLNNRI